MSTVDMAKDLQNFILRLLGTGIVISILIIIL